MIEKPTFFDPNLDTSKDNKLKKKNIDRSQQVSETVFKEYVPKTTPDAQKELNQSNQRQKVDIHSQYIDFKSQTLLNENDEIDDIDLISNHYKVPTQPICPKIQLQNEDEDRSVHTKIISYAWGGRKQSHNPNSLENTHKKHFESQSNLKSFRTNVNVHRNVSC